MSKSWYNMTPAKAEGGAAEILLYDTIGGWGISAKQFASDLKALAGGNITLRINSPGGDVMEGAAIFNILKADGRPVTVYIDGLAASMASVVAMAGKVIMPANALMMIHNPWTLSMGDADRLRKDADLLDKIKGQIVGAYEGKCGAKQSRDAIVAMMDAETWMDGKEAVAAGFADECGEEIQAAACVVDVTKYAAKVDARLAAILPKAEVSDDAASTGQPVAPVAPPEPVLLDAAVVESRIESERARAFQDGAASRQAEVDGLLAESARVKADLTKSQETIAQLNATVEAERAARTAAVSAHQALMGGLKFVPSDSTQTWDELVRQHGYEKARKMYPESYDAFMAAKAPGLKKARK